MHNIDDEIKEYFEEIPQIDKREIQNLQELTKKNKRVQPRRTFFQKYGVAICCCILMLCCCVPTFFIRPADDNPNPIYYTESDVSQLQIDENIYNYYFNNQCSKYAFVKDLGTIEMPLGYYIPNTTTLLAFYLNIKPFGLPPMANLNLLFVIDSSFINTKHNFFVTNAEYTETKEYKLYKKEEKVMQNESLTAYFEYSNYKLYFDFNFIDDDIFKLFL